MGMDLLSDHGDERFSAAAWYDCLERAIEFGWNPEGTLAPIVPMTPSGDRWVGEWNGGYHTNDYQQVTDRDARALGRALLRAADALSAQAKLRKRRAQLRLVSSVQANVVAIERPPRGKFFEEEDPLEAEISCLRRLADFALKGGFVIA